MKNPEERRQKNIVGMHTRIHTNRQIYDDVQHTHKYTQTHLKHSRARIPTGIQIRVRSALVCSFDTNKAPSQVEPLAFRRLGRKAKVCPKAKTKTRRKRKRKKEEESQTLFARRDAIYIDCKFASSLFGRQKEHPASLLSKVSPLSTSTSSLKASQL